MKRLLACSLSAAVCGIFFAACGGASAESVCDKTCDCVGCSDAEREDCIDEIDDAEREADAEGCGSEYSAALDCYQEEMECESSGRIEVTGCDSVLEDLADCLGTPFVIGESECTEACEAAKECEGSDPTTDCGSVCAEGVANAASVGCSDEYDGLLACAAAIPDVCNAGTACQEEAATFGDCYQQACTDSPELPACN